MSTQNKVTILVIDDDPDLQELIRQLLLFQGMEVLQALNATQGVTILREASQPPHCLILDLMLPDISGLDVLKQIRSKPAFDAMPIVILSALADPDKIREGFALGADRYITKPYLPSNLVTVVNEVLTQGRRKQ